MTDIEHVSDDFPLGEPAPLREGLPPRYRMRADPHYVDQLDSSPFSAPVRLIDVRSIDAPTRGTAGRPSAPFVESVRQHGVLQPLLLRSRAGRYEVIAGGKRLAAALASGLRAVPCFVEHVEDDRARALAEATNVPSAARDRSAGDAVQARKEPALDAFADCLTAVASSARLLSRGATLAETVAVDLVRAEVARAMDLLQATRVLRGDATVTRRSVPAHVVVSTAVAHTAPARRLRGIALDTGVSGAASPALDGDEALLAFAAGSLVMGLVTLLDQSGSPTIRLDVAVGTEGTATLTARREGELSSFWRSNLVSDGTLDLPPVPGRAELASTLAVLRAARAVAVLHGGQMAVDCLDGATCLSLSVPVWPS